MKNKTVIAIILLSTLSNCAVPFANGFTAKDLIQTANGVRNLQKITNEATREEMITEAKNILKSIQSNALTQN